MEAIPLGGSKKDCAALLQSGLVNHTMMEPQKLSPATSQIFTVARGTCHIAITYLNNDPGDARKYMPWPGYMESSFKDGYDKCVVKHRQSTALISGEVWYNIDAVHFQGILYNNNTNWQSSVNYWKSGAPTATLKDTSVSVVDHQVHDLPEDAEGQIGAQDPPPFAADQVHPLATDDADDASETAALLGESSRSAADTPHNSQLPEPLGLIENSLDSDSDSPTDNTPGDIENQLDTHETKNSASAQAARLCAEAASQGITLAGCP